MFPLWASAPPLENEEARPGGLNTLMVGLFWVSVPFFSKFITKSISVGRQEADGRPLLLQVSIRLASRTEAVPSHPSSTRVQHSATQFQATCESEP